MFALSCDIDDSIFTLEYADSVPALSKAARVGDLDKIKELISKGNLPQTPDNRGWTSIHCCVAANQIEALKLILKLKKNNKKYLVNLTTWENITPLLIALKTSPPSLEMVKLLLKSGASPNLYTHTKISPLHLACLRKGNIEFVRLLVQNGADVNVQEDFNMFTPLHVAVCEAYDADITKYLIELSDLSMRDVHDRTAFLEACNNNFLEGVKIFLEKDKNLANVNESVPPIVYAGMCGNLEMAKLLIQSGADVNVRCKAMVFCRSSDSDLILLDRENFLPIHSSLVNVETFKFLLSLTKPTEILQLDKNFCNFPLFVMVYADVCFFEALLQSNVSDKLKAISCRVLINFILAYPQMMDIVSKKFPLFFKYNFYLEPEDVFQNFFCQMSTEELIESYQFLHILAQMGISSEDQLGNKKTVIQYLDSSVVKNEHFDVIRLTCDLLSQSVLSLKQLCRIVVRRYIRSQVENDWLAYTMVKDGSLPDPLKSFLFFETFR